MLMIWFFYQLIKKLHCLIPKIKTYLLKNLKLNLHADKIFIKTIASGVDFLGAGHFLGHHILRRSTR